MTYAEHLGRSLPGAESVWSKLSKVDVNKHIETKGGFSYLSWSWAWSYVKDNYPDATFHKHVFNDLPYMLDPAGFAYVQVTVTILSQAATEIMPVLNHTNKAMQNPDSFAVNAALMRCLVKAIAFHGLGHYIYQGEDLPPGTEPKQVVIPPAPPPVIEQQANTVADVAESSLIVSLRACRSKRDLTAWERDHDGEIAWVQTNDAAAFAELKTVVKQQKEKLNG